MSDVETVTDGGLTPAENAFFESKGETPLDTTRPEVKPEAKPEEKSGEDKADKVEKVVPLAALHEERRERQARDKRIRELELENARFQERFKIVEDKAKPAAAPNPDEDPFAYAKHVGTEVDGLKEKLTGYERQEQARTQQGQVLNAYSNSVKAFKETAPDFDDAYKVAVSARQKVYELIGHPDPVSAAQMDEFQLVTAALQQGKNPAEVIYELARAQGFQPKAKDDKPNGADKLDTIARGQAANKSLASVGGSGGPDEMTAEALLKMPMDEFEAWTNKNPAKARRLMGGN